MRIRSRIGTLLLIALSSAGCGATSDDPGTFDTNSEGITISPSAVYTLTGVQSGKCVEVVGGTSTAGARLQIATCTGATRQQWRTETMGGAFYRLRNVNSNLCMEVSGASTADRAAVVQSTCGTGVSQQWSFADVQSGAERITARVSNKVLDVAGQRTTDGTLLQQYTGNGGTNQQFRMSASTAPAPLPAPSPAPTAAPAPTPTPTPGKVFGSCRFHFGTTDSKAKATPSMIPELDFFTPGWMGQKDTFDMGYVCSEGNPGAILGRQVPVIVAYVAAFYAKRHFGRCDCNVSTCGAGNDLCHFGAADIQNNLQTIVGIYESYAQGFASCYGTTRPIIFEMEPDWYQYIGSSQTKPFSEAQAGSIMGQFVSAVKKHLPNAVFSMDVSPWAGNNGADNGAEWFSHFDMSQFTFINTSGGGTNASTTRIRSSNQMSWAGVRQVTGKPMLADTGYGANGVSAGPDPNWDVASNINARMADGVSSISQYNPSSSWGSTIAQLRAQLGAPKTCP